MPSRVLRAIEVCAGAGGQALGLEQAGFRHVACVELDGMACATLRANRPEWPVIQADLRDWVWEGDGPVDLIAGGVPCPPYSVAGRQHGPADDRDLFGTVLRLVKEVQPRSVMIENVRGLLQRRFDGYRAEILADLGRMGYSAEWKLLQASDFGVPQLRPRSVLVALRSTESSAFEWPGPVGPAPSVGEVLLESMAWAGWRGAGKWAENATGVAPTLVGGSKLHGGPDLGPTRARREWMERFGVDGRGLADSPPGPAHAGAPRLTVAQAAMLQGFPPDWAFQGRKTSAYRQVGNAFPPPVARAVGAAIAAALCVVDAGAVDGANGTRASDAHH